MQSAQFSLNCLVQFKALRKILSHCKSNSHLDWAGRDCSVDSSMVRKSSLGK